MAEILNADIPLSCPHTDGRVPTECPECQNYREAIGNIRALEVQLAVLEVTELEGRRRMNLSHERLHTLPPEMTSRIFEIAVEDGITPLALGRVCRTWRTVAWSTPSLWADIRFVLNPRPVEPAPASLRRIMLFGEMVNRSGAMDLSISIYKISSIRCDIPRGHILPLLGVLENVGARLSVLHLQLPLEVFRELEHLNTPNLQSLTLESFYPVRDLPGHRRLNLSSLSNNLKNLTVISLNLDRILLPCPNVNHINLEHCPLRACTSLFHNATSLRTCSINTLLIPGFLPPFGVPRRTVLPHLTTLFLCYRRAEGVEGVSAILDQFTFPSLTELRVPQEYKETDVPLPMATILLALLARSRCPLRTISLPRGSWTVEDLIAMLSLTPTLTTLELNETVQSRSMSEIFSIVFPHHPPSTHPKIQHFKLGTIWTNEDTATGWRFLKEVLPPRDDNVADSERHYPQQVTIEVRIPAAESGNFRLDDEVANFILGTRCKVEIQCSLRDGADYRFDLVKLYCMENTPADEDVDNIEDEEYEEYYGYLGDVVDVDMH